MRGGRRDHVGPLVVTKKRKQKIRCFVLCLIVIIYCVIFVWMHHLLSPFVSLSSWNVLQNHGFGSSRQQDQSVLECGIWVAPSVLPGAGLGLYAGKAYRRGQRMQQPVGDLVIPIVDLVAHNQHERFDFMMNHYAWTGESLGMEQEGRFNVNGASLGLGAVANAFHAMVNVDESTCRRNAVQLHRSHDPGVGAFTPYFDRLATASREIAPGEELYINYGPNWFQCTYKKRFLYHTAGQTSRQAAHILDTPVVVVFVFFCVWRQIEPNLVQYP